jgi:hypothetical protein
VSHDATAEPTTRLAHDLRTLQTHANGQAIALSTVIDVLGERGHALVMIVLAFPFLLPVPTMGLSAPAGLALALMGVCLALRFPPWLPGFLGRRQIAYATLSGAIAGALRMEARVGRMLRPRLPFVLWPASHVLLGLGLVFAGVALALPIPLPFANAIPALAIVVYSAGLIERDGLFILAGHAVNAAVVVLGVVLADVIWSAVQPMVAMFA